MLVNRRLTADLVDVDTTIFGTNGQARIRQQSHVETLLVTLRALKASLHVAGLNSHLPINIDRSDYLIEDGDIEGLVVVCDHDVSILDNNHSDWEIHESASSNGTNELASVVEDLNAIQTVVTDENLILIVDTDVVRELQAIGTIEAVQEISVPVEDDDSHDLKELTEFPLNEVDGCLALDDRNTTTAVHCKSARMFQDIGSKATHETTSLVVNLNLSRRHALADNEASVGLIDRNSKNEPLTDRLASNSQSRLKCCCRNVTYRFGYRNCPSSLPCVPNWNLNFPSTP